MRKFTAIFFMFTFAFILLTGLNHTVKKGDTLWDIAGHYYEDPFLWPIIYEANKNNIKDPHWIYPDQVFAIPPYQEEETRAVIPETTGVESVPAKIETTTTTTSAKPVISPTPTTQEKVTPTPEEASKKPEKIKIISVLKAPTGKKKSFRKITLIAPTKFSFAKSLAYSAGYITDEQDFNIGKIVQGAGDIEQNRFIMNDKVIINRGIEDGIKEGNIYTVYRMGNAVYDPITDDYLGNVVKILGDIQVLDTEKHTAVVKILRSFEPIKVGDLFMKRFIPSLPSGTPKPFISNITGHLVYFKGESQIIKPFNIVYVKPDSDYTLQLGDILLLYRENTIPTESGEGALPIIPVGKIQVINLKGSDGTATGYMLSIMGHNAIKLGDKFRVVGRIEK